MRKPEVIENTEIMPCPFCGNNVVEIEQHQTGQWDAILYTATVRCNKCGMNGPTASCRVNIHDSKWNVREHTRQQAIELWNKRV